MKTTNAQKKLAEKNILLIEPETTPANHCRRLHAFANGHRLEISTQGENVAMMRVARSDDKDEILSDYFAGYWVETMPQVFRAMGIQ